MTILRNLVPETSTLTTIQNTLYVMLLVLFMTAIIPFFLLIFYAHPSADDYSYANVFLTGDFWERIVGEYKAWKGRYFGIFVTVLFHKSGNMLENYHYPLFLFLTLLFIAFYYFVRSVFEENGPFIRTFYCSFALGVYYIVSMPDVSASLYWADGAFQYQVGSIFYLLAIASILRLYREHESTALPALLSVIFIFSAIGSTEIFMISLLSFVGLIFPYKFFILKQNRIAWSIVLAVAIVSTSLLVLSPGNAIRMEFFPNSGQFWFSISRSIYYGVPTLGTWLSLPSFWLMSILFIPVVLHLVYISRIRKDANWISLILLLALILGQIWVSFFASWWGTGSHPQGRTQNTIYLVFLAGWFMFILEFIAVLSRERKLVYIDSLFSTPVRIIMIIATFFFGLLLVTKTHVPDAYSALAGPAREYDRMMKNRYAYIEQKQLESSNSRLSLSLESIENAPQILVFSDITKDKDDWNNRSFATYFGLSTVVRK